MAGAGAGCDPPNWKVFSLEVVDPNRGAATGFEGSGVAEGTDALIPNKGFCCVATSGLPAGADEPLVGKMGADEAGFAVAPKRAVAGWLA